MDRTMCSSSPDLGPVLCEVPCSRDCVLSDWTSWSTCSQTCSSKTMEGKQMRMRSILAYNAGEGVSAAGQGLCKPRPSPGLAVSLSLTDLGLIRVCFVLTVTAMVVAWITVMEGNVIVQL